MQVKKHLDLLFRDLTTFGGVFFISIITVLFGLKRMYGMFFHLLFGMVFIYWISVVLKAAHFKARPKKEKYTNWFEKLEASSFPSTHSITAVFLAFTFMEFFGKMIIDIFLIALAGSVCYSRIYLRKHDWVDVITGIIVGMVTFYVVKAVVIAI